jgi:hypothetical protein
MAAGATYEPIATANLSGVTSYDFSSIPATYTDLRLVVSARTSAADNLSIRINSDTGTNYSELGMMGNGAAASSWIRSNATYIRPTNGIGTPTAANTFMIGTFDFMSYAGSANKSILITASNDQNGSGDTVREIGLWRNTVAITAIRVLTNFAATFQTGTTVTLYGIKAA